MRHEIGAKFVVCNNRSYQLFKSNLQWYWQERGLADHPFPGSFDLGNPVIRFDELAKSMGVPATRVATPDQVAPAIEHALAEDGPFLIDLLLHQEVHDHDEDAANRPGAPLPRCAELGDLGVPQRVEHDHRGRRAQCLQFGEQIHQRIEVISQDPPEVVPVTLSNPAGGRTAGGVGATWLMNAASALAVMARRTESLRRAAVFSWRHVLRP